MERIREKRYYRLTFSLASPLSVSSGKNENTDRDVMTDVCDDPYIPASAVAGVCRSQFEKDTSHSFGFVQIADRANMETDAEESRILFYDARMTGKTGRFHVSARDSVALDEYKTAKEGAKFDMEVVEPGTEFVTFIEQNVLEQDDEETANTGDEVAGYWLGEGLSFGGKTTRGYGRIENVAVKRKVFNMATDAERWLSFDMYDEKCWEDAKTVSKEEGKVKDQSLVLELNQAGGISIRKYTTKVPEKEGDSEPDFEQLTARVSGKDGEKTVPVIPGTTWAGAFSHRMAELVPACKEGNLFGIVSENEKVKSHISFSETQLYGGYNKVMTRNAIDRFTGGAADSALFTESSYYGGTGKLTITVEKGYMTAEVKRALAAAVADLHNGFLAVGGMTSVGRGLFRVVSVNGKHVSDDDLFGAVMGELKEDKG